VRAMTESGVERRSFAVGHAVSHERIMTRGPANEWRRTPCGAQDERQRGGILSWVGVAHRKAPERAGILFEPQMPRSAVGASKEQQGSRRSQRVAQGPSRLAAPA